MAMQTIFQVAGVMEREGYYDLLQWRQNLFVHVRGGAGAGMVKVGWTLFVLFRCLMQHGGTLRYGWPCYTSLRLRSTWIGYEFR